MIGIVHIDGQQAMNTEILKKIISEWLEETVFPPLVRRDAPELVLDRVSEIIALAV
jgi:hypothetical protein